MKRTLAFLLVLVLSLVMLVGCSTKKSTEVASFDWKGYDERINAIRSETDFAKREVLMHEAEDQLMGTYALCPLYYYNDVYMMKPGVEGFYSTAYGYKYFMNVTNGDATTLRVCLASEPDKLDPALNSSVDGACLAVNSFCGLYTYNAEGAIVPNLAESCAVSDDGLVYTFTMKKDLKWSDGTPLTAKDFEYSWKRAIDPKTAADYAYMYDSGNIKDFAASEDGLTFTVNLSAPCAYFYDLCAFPTFYAVNQACVEGAAGAAENPGAWATEAGFVSSGAFILESWKHNESMVYVKNPNYWDAANVKLERIEFMLSDDDTAILAAYNAGDLDFIDGVPNDEIAGLKDREDFYIVDQLGTYYVCFNVKSDLFAGKTVEQANKMRKAFALLIDRQYIVDTCGQTGQQPANTFIPAKMANGHGGEFRVNDDGYSYPNAEETGYYSVKVDVEGAIKLLEEAGYKFKDGKLASSTPISFEYLTNESSGHIAIAECIQQDLAKVGINMTIRSIEWSVFLDERKVGNYDIARNGWVADFNDPINMLEMWTTESGNNDVQFGRFGAAEEAAK